MTLLSAEEEPPVHVVVFEQRDVRTGVGHAADVLGLGQGQALVAEEVAALAIHNPDNNNNNNYN